MVKLTCKFPIIQNVSLIVLKHHLLEFNWYGAITQCMHPVNILTTKLGIKIVCKRIRTRRSVEFLQLWPNGWMDQDATWCLVKRQALAQATSCQMGTQPPTAAPPHFWPMPIVVKRSPISATAELLSLIMQHCRSVTVTLLIFLFELVMHINYLQQATQRPKCEQSYF